MTRLLTPPQLAELRRNHDRVGNGADPDAVAPVVKLTGRGTDAVWLLSEVEMDGTTHGLFDDGDGRIERSAVSLTELEELTAPGSADLPLFDAVSGFRATKTIGEYEAEARRLGRIAI